MKNQAPEKMSVNQSTNVDMREAFWHELARPVHTEPEI